MKNSLVLLCALVISLAIAEASVRGLMKGSIELMPRYHTGAEYGSVRLRTIRPNIRFTHTTIDGSWNFSTNSKGFRDFVEHDYEKPLGRVRVVAIGDSHTQGYECHQEYTFSSVLERVLRRSGIDAEAINAGVSGFSTAEAMLLFEHELVKYSPDYVVLGFFANDYEDNLKSGLFGLDDTGQLLQLKGEHLPGVKIQDAIYAIPGVKWLGENSYFYSLLFNTLWSVAKHQLSSFGSEPAPDEYAIATRAEFDASEMRLTAALVERLGKVVRESGAKLIIVDIPQRVDSDEIFTSVMAEVAPAIQSASDRYISSEILAPYSGAALLHVPNGGNHITEFSHTIIGIAIAGWIQQDLARGSD